MEVAAVFKMRTISIRRCDRCGKSHVPLTFSPFTRRVGRWTHWSLCPETGEPVLMRFEERESVTV